jgi:hypothetical protein
VPGEHATSANAEPGVGPCIDQAQLSRRSLCGVGAESVSRRCCAFCGGDELTREHVYARWMSKYFRDISGFTASGWIGADQDDIVTYDPPGPLPGRAVGNTLRRGGSQGAFNLTTRWICRPCNSGWMAELEADVEPILGPMFAGQPTLLSGRRAEVLATWCIKTSLVMTLAWDRSLPPDPFHDLYRDRRPSESTTVWCAYRPEFAITHYHQPLQSRLAKPSGFPDGYAATMLLGHAVIGVAQHFMESPAKCAVMSPTCELRVWPPPTGATTGGSWPSPKPVSDERLAQWIQPSNPTIARPR